VGPAGLLAVDVPAGEHRLEVTYRAPGLGLGRAAALAAVTLAVLHAVVAFAVSRRRRRRGPAAGAPGPRRGPAT
jgi:hypothetical protein